MIMLQCTRGQSPWPERAVTDSVQGCAAQKEDRDWRRLLEKEHEAILDGLWEPVVGLDREGKTGEKALEGEDEMFRILVEESPLGVAVIAKDGRYKYVNGKFLEIFGYRLHEVPTGKAWFEKAFPDPTHRRQVVSTWKRDLEQSRIGERRPRIFTVCCKDGSRKPIHFRPVTLRSGDELVLYEDITRSQAAEAGLRRSRKMEALGTLASGIAHDFNNILGAIIGYAEMMEMFDVPVDSPVRAGLDEVLKAGHRAKDLVRQILTFSRNTEEARRPVPVEEIVEEALGFLHPSLPPEISVEKDLVHTGACVWADPTQMHQVVMNLCTNAVHAMMATGGVLTVRVEEGDISGHLPVPEPDLPPGRYVKLTVGDSGHGMDPDTLERIFDPYFTTKQPSLGTGMGLAVVHGIVKSHGGTVQVESEKGRGSLFTVWVPAHEGAGLSPRRSSGIKPPSGHERILFVDDEEVLAGLGKAMLERLGYEAVASTSGPDALDRFRAQPDGFDLVVTDQVMPRMTGVELARELVGIRPGLPIVICTGYSESLPLEQARAMGIRHLVLKPLGAVELGRIVRAALDGRDL